MCLSDRQCDLNLCGCTWGLLYAVYPLAVILHMRTWHISKRKVRLGECVEFEKNIYSKSTCSLMHSLSRGWASQECVWHDKNAGTMMHVYVPECVSKIPLSLFQNAHTHTYTTAHTTVCAKMSRWNIEWWYMMEEWDKVPQRGKRWTD